MADSKLQPELDDLSRFEAKDTAHELPVGWTLLFWGLVVWGAWYLWKYSPWLGGWTQVQDLDAAQRTSSGMNVFATILFTALATIAAVVTMLVFARRKRRNEGR
jgi:hypothetical protein